MEPGKLPEQPVFLNKERTQEVRGWFRSVGYCWAEISRRIDMVENVFFKTEWYSTRMARVVDRLTGTVPVDDLDVLVRLFALHVVVPAEAFDKTVPADIAGSLEEMRLIVREGDTVRAPLVLVEYGDILIVSDSLDIHADDLVLMPIGASFVIANQVTKCPGDRSLDLGMGAGVPCLYSHKSHREVYGVDIAERCVWFSKFNAHLNDIQNAHFLTGSLFDPVRGKKFHVITGNIPWVPDATTPEDAVNFWSGGPKGDRFVRKIIEALPQYLEMGGYLFLKCLTLTWSDGSTNPSWDEWTRAGYDILLMANEVDTYNSFAVPQGENQGKHGGERPDWGALIRVDGAVLYDIGIVVVRMTRQPDSSQPGFFVRGPWVEKPPFDVHELFEALASASDAGERDTITRSFYARG